jgi:SAM-dependent methyltransferase
MSAFRTFVKRYFPRLVYLRNYLKASALRSTTYRDVFDGYYERNKWSDPESRSGPGSSLLQTEPIRRQLPELCRKYNIRSLLDIPCGDFNWMQHVQLDVDQYIGADIVEKLIQANNERYGNDRRKFLRMDIAVDALPRVDLIFCRDCLVHLTEQLVLQALKNIRASGSTYLLTTTHIHLKHNMNIVTGQWRPLNLQRPPFNLPEPLAFIDENPTADTEIREGKRLALWRIDSL